MRLINVDTLAELRFEKLGLNCLPCDNIPPECNLPFYAERCVSLKFMDCTASAFELDKSSPGNIRTWFSNLIGGYLASMGRLPSYTQLDEFCGGCREKNCTPVNIKVQRLDREFRVPVIK